MDIRLIIGNVFSFFYAVCIAISVVKKDKKNAIWWQIIDVICCIISEIALLAYAALTTNVIALLRNWLVYKNKLTIKMTAFCCALFISFGLYTNNRGYIGLLPILAGSSYCVFLYLSKNAQHIRYALITNLPLWMIHDFYIKSYPAAIVELILTIWTIIQIFRHRDLNKKKRA